MSEQSRAEQILEQVKQLLNRCAAGELCEGEMAVQTAPLWMELDEIRTRQHSELRAELEALHELMGEHDERLMELEAFGLTECAATQFIVDNGQQAQFEAYFDEKLREVSLTICEQPARLQ